MGRRRLEMEWRGGVWYDLWMDLWWMRSEFEISVFALFETSWVTGVVEVVGGRMEAGLGF